MRNNLRSMLGLLILVIALTGAAPWKSLPSSLLGKWEGITFTDPNGESIGAVDLSDWGCLGGGTAPQGVPVPPPSAVCMSPAFPNPTSTSTVIRYSLRTTSLVSLVVYGKKGNGPHGAFPVRTLVSQQSQAGAYSVLWDGKDDQGVPVSPDIYRVVMTVDDKDLSGDVQIQ